jgi:ubiquinone/menaquinone biosynthesis C-methylase UbiE
MPEESMWIEFFDPATVLQSLRLTANCGDVVDFGCGYGTFTLSAARMISGKVHALDIEPEMIDITRTKAEKEGLGNVRVCLRDFVAEGSGLPSASVGYVMLFNILHAERPEVLLRESARILKPHGLLAIIHWRYDPSTPRGPSMDIRPRPEQCRDWAVEQGLVLLDPGILDLPPYHYGMVFERPE